MIEVKMQMPDLPEGFEYTGEFRNAVRHEFAMSDQLFECCVDRMSTPYPIVRRVPKWRPARFGDLGKNLTARFGDVENELKHTSKLCGWSKYSGLDKHNWLDTNGHAWRFCEVLEPTP